MTEQGNFSNKNGDMIMTIAILPLGAFEQHGPHLPFETDRLIVEGIAARLKHKAGDNLDLLWLEAEPVGYSVEHLDFSGSQSLTYEAAIARWLGILRQLSVQGITKCLLLNAHGGNSPLLTIVATEARVRFNMLAVTTSWSRFGLPDGIMTPENKALDIHGGQIETSIMLALHPERVNMEKAEDFTSRQSDFIERFKHLRAYGPHAFGWKMQDLNEKGVTGNAQAATAAMGEAILDHATTGIIELLEDMDRFDVSTLSQD
jgi:creatinine amidohydrolase